MLGYSSGKTGTKHGYSVAFSADGLQWQMYPKNPGCPAENMHPDPRPAYRRIPGVLKLPTRTGGTRGG